MPTTIHVLGTGTPTPTAASYGTSFAIERSDGSVVMIDCGPAATWKLAKAGINPAAVSHLFLTHHHFDHNVDYPCLILTRWDQDTASRPLKVFGPEPTARMTEQLIGQDGAFAPDYRARIGWVSSQRTFENRGGTLPRRPPLVDATDIVADFVYDGADWSIRAAHAEHAQPFLDCLAYRFSTDDGDVVFSGDTEPCESVIKLAEGADVLFCMAWETEPVIQANGETVGACSSGGAGKIASWAGVKRLVLVHTGPRITEARDEAVADAAQHFDGEITFAEEISTIAVNTLNA